MRVRLGSASGVATGHYAPNVNQRLPAHKWPALGMFAERKWIQESKSLWPISIKGQIAYAHLVFGRSSRTEPGSGLLAARRAGPPDTAAAPDVAVPTPAGRHSGPSADIDSAPLKEPRSKARATRTFTLKINFITDNTIKRRIIIIVLSTCLRTLLDFSIHPCLIIPGTVA
ncbi:hypothetical protein K1T71_004775 [Dendrolimus kikuchii]|uniref:Uncharacterized protein n=1 Tax=Dendrolimus kikuchii TaxID=765133 RepID=A0ACC1D888_9NEOP|nr:hypothetical protein K1T71_004775 [Dendrolimus kikuchii]